MIPPNPTLHFKFVTKAFLTKLISIISLLCFSTFSVAEAVSTNESVDGKREQILSHVNVLENSWKLSSKDLSILLESKYLSHQYLADTSKYQRDVLFERIKKATKQAQAVLVDMQSSEIQILLEGRERHTVAFKVEESLPYKITSLRTFKKINGLNLNLTPSNIQDKFSLLEKEHNFSGVVYLMLNGKVVMNSAYGYKDPSNKLTNSTNTIFGIGSRPIDFTTVAVYLLEQEGKLDLNDKLSKFYDVSPDKYNITIDHLLMGKSGLPDFHHLASDDDPDLTWIDKKEAVGRILTQPLMFKPGEKEYHSHSAFVLLSAIIEDVSGRDYFQFISEEFLKPAGMLKTGEYGNYNGHKAPEFAVGGGPSTYGETNIPPLWGKTSWLIKGSGGMYSNVSDLVKFYDYVRHSGKLKEKYSSIFNGPITNMDGSDRGFELFSSYDEKGNDQVFVISNMTLPNPLMFEIKDDLIKLIRKN